MNINNLEKGVELLSDLNLFTDIVERLQNKGVDRISFTDNRAMPGKGYIPIGITKRHQKMLSAHLQLYFRGKIEETKSKIQEL